MAARCRSKTGCWTWSVLDLNHCIAYQDGRDKWLTAQDEGNFFEFAQPCSSDNSTTSWATYQCAPYAGNQGGQHLNLGIDLNKLVGNDNGTLVCGRQAFKGTMLSQEQISWSEDGIEISQGQ
ncbi:hypothetical protein CGGC5_v015981 [Colletotrichum fructicola Nara gc5]|uniref:Cyanovirin-N domain-containing protein n=1 Tax=Colletotrichum fructicola (strain Nara gc5) TaxID=1213859 RepID=A0A7J6IHJ2_COLFN|nr:hypothetical protein CGGC5_v015981 [Colletotrichum fructicola Nara gc5]